MDVTTEITHRITVTEKKLRLISKALGHMAKPHLIKLREGEAEAAWELNKEILAMRRNGLNDQMKIIVDALRKVDEIEQEEAVNKTQAAS